MSLLKVAAEAPTAIDVSNHADTTVLSVNEIFGPTFQGEGPTAGRRASFVRLGRCDLACSWCDTPYTWDWTGRNGRAFDPVKELRSVALADVIDTVKGHGTNRVVITGGEPLLQRRAVTSLVKKFLGDGLAVEIETNGRHRPLDLPGVRYNVSPKLASSGDPRHKRLRWDRLSALSRADSVFKFVCADPAELAEVAEIVETAEIQAAQVWISPLGTTESEIGTGLRALADPVLDRGWNLSTRLHVLAWGDERGR